ncbi:hypothetical protein ACET3Z_025723 [Daucus carota]
MDILLAGKNQKEGGYTPIRENLDSKNRPMDRRKTRTHEALIAKQLNSDDCSVEPPKKEKEICKDQDKTNSPNLVPGRNPTGSAIELGMPYIEVKEISCWKVWDGERPYSQVKVENPLIWIYSDCLEKIEEMIEVMSGETKYGVKIVEIEDRYGHLFDAVHQKFNSPKRLGQSRKGKREDKQSMGGLVDSSLISHVSETEGGQFVGCVISESAMDNLVTSDEGNGSVRISIRKEGNLEWEFSNSIDRRDRDLVEVGDLEKLGSSQEESLCRLMKTIKLKGVGRPRRKKGKN